MKNTVQITKEKKLELEQELKDLIAKRPEIAAEIAIARDFGDLSENAEYDAARENQTRVESRIVEIENILKNAKIIKNSVRNKVVVGTTVVVNSKGKEKTYSIVGQIEADPLSNKISNESPLGKVLMGKKVGETAEFEAPKGKIVYKIASIS
ncbi:MAG: transcription elongation factor GreA [Candidatus Nomurabacteria bacterium]|jgi:transcription elongation factor GreA|nr:transcription elongation factor GreA [Candidatus Nomurabacteria bacterium]